MFFFRSLIRCFHNEVNNIWPVFFIQQIVSNLPALFLFFIHNFILLLIYLALEVTKCYLKVKTSKHIWSHKLNLYCDPFNEKKYKKSENKIDFFLFYCFILYFSMVLYLELVWLKLLLQHSIVTFPTYKYRHIIHTFIMSNPYFYQFEYEVWNLLLST